MKVLVKLKKKAILEVLEGFRNGEYAIHCEEEWQAKQLFKMLRKTIWHWCDGDKIGVKTYWSENKNKTAYIGKTNDDYGLNYMNIKSKYIQGQSVLSYDEFIGLIELELRQCS